MTSIIRADNISTVAGTGTIAVQSGNTLDASAGFTPPAGHIIQVVSSEKDLTTATVTSSTSYVASGFDEVSIIPIRANSKLLVSFRGFNPHVNAANGNYGVAYKVFIQVNGGGYSAVTSTRNAGYYQYTAGTNYWKDYDGYIQYLDAPTYSLGQQVDYKIYFRAPNSNTNNAYDHHAGGISSQSEHVRLQKIIMEIAG